MQRRIKRRDVLLAAWRLEAQSDRYPHEQVRLQITVYRRQLRDLRRAIRTPRAVPPELKMSPARAPRRHPV